MLVQIKTAEYFKMLNILKLLFIINRKFTQRIIDCYEINNLILTKHDDLIEFDLT